MKALPILFHNQLLLLLPPLPTPPVTLVLNGSMVADDLLDYNLSWDLCMSVGCVAQLVSSSKYALTIFIVDTVNGLDECVDSDHVKS